MADAKQIAHALGRVGNAPRVFGLTMGEREQMLAGSLLLPEMLAALESAEWMLCRDRIDPQKSEVIDKVQAAIRAAGGKVRYG